MLDLNYTFVICKHESCPLWPPSTILDAPCLKSKAPENFQRHFKFHGAIKFLGRQIKTAPLKKDIETERYQN